MGKAIAFARVSTYKQDLEQHKRVLEDEARKLGYNEIIFIGDKESGRSLKEEERVTLQEMWNQIENDPQIECVIAFEISRIARKPKICFSVRDQLQSRHIQLIVLNPYTVCFDDDWKLNSGANLVFSIFAAMAENEGNLLIERTSRGKHKRTSEGYYVGGPVTFGYKVDENKKLVVDEEKAPIVREIFNLRSKSYTARQIVDELNQRGINIKWSQVTSILNNETYCGRTTVSRKGKKTPKTLPALITEALYDFCSGVGTTVHKVRESRSERKYLGRKILYCAECGNLIQVHCTRGHTYYSCGTHTRHKIQDKYCSNSVVIKIEFVDNLIWRIAKNLYKFKMMMDKDESVHQMEEELKIVQSKIEGAEKELEKISKKSHRMRYLYLDDELTQEEYENLSRGLKSAKNEVLHRSEQLGIRKDALRNEINALRNDEMSMVDKLSILDRIDSENDFMKKNEIVHQMFTKITLGECGEYREIIFWNGDNEDHYLITKRNVKYYHSLQIINGQTVHSQMEEVTDTKNESISQSDIIFEKL